MTTTAIVGLEPVIVLKRMTVNTFEPLGERTGVLHNGIDRHEHDTIDLIPGAAQRISPVPGHQTFGRWREHCHDAPPEWQKQFGEDDLRV